MVVAPAATRIQGRRFWALVIDVTLQALAWVLVLRLWPGGGLGEILAEERASGELTGSQVQALLVGLGIAFGYQMALEAAFSTTLGKAVMGLKTVRFKDGDDISPQQAIVRGLFKPLFFFSLFTIIDIVAIIADSRHRRLGDFIARTVVVGEAPSAPAYDSERGAREKAGARAEEATAAELTPLTEDGHHLFTNLMTDSSGDIDAAVVGPEGITIVETKANAGEALVEGGAYIVVGGQPLHRDAVRQVLLQKSDIKKRVGGGLPVHWMICLPNATLAPDGVPDEMRPHIANLAGLVMKLRSRDRGLSPQQVDRVAERVERAYGKAPRHKRVGR